MDLKELLNSIDEQQEITYGTPLDPQVKTLVDRIRNNMDNIANLNPRKDIDSIISILETTSKWATIAASIVKKGNNNA